MNLLDKMLHLQSSIRAHSLPPGLTSNLEIFCISRAISIIIT